MRTDVTSMFFNSSIEGKTATPAWGTSIGQSKQRKCRIDDFKPEVINMLVGMTFRHFKRLCKARNPIMFSIYRYFCEWGKS